MADPDVYDYEPVDPEQFDAMAARLRDELDLSPAQRQHVHQVLLAKEGVPPEALKNGDGPPDRDA